MVATRRSHRHLLGGDSPVLQHRRRGHRGVACTSLTSCRYDARLLITDRDTAPWTQTQRIQQLKREADAAKLLDQLDASSAASTERQILLAAFEHQVGRNGRLAKDQLKPLAAALSAQIVLRDEEVELMWTQICTAAGDQAGSDDDKLSAISFGGLWRWWLTGDVLASPLFAPGKRA